MCDIIGKLKGQIADIHNPVGDVRKCVEELASRIAAMETPAVNPVNEMSRDSSSRDDPDYFCVGPFGPRDPRVGSGAPAGGAPLPCDRARTDRLLAPKRNKARNPHKRNTDK